MMLNWNEFESLMDAAAGDPSKAEFKSQRDQNLYLKNVILKRKALEEQQSLFSQASEETILKEYRKLRKAHRDFISTFEEARSAYVFPPEKQ